MTALMSAAFYGSEEITKILLDNGANINSKGFLGWTALTYATQGRHIKVAEFLLEHGAYVNVADVYGRTVLMLAEEKKYGEIAQLLRKYGARE